MLSRLTTLFLLLVTLAGTQSARAAFPDSIAWSVSGEATVSGGAHSPFWLTSNTQGLMSVKPNNGYIRLGATKAMSYDRRFSWGAGADIAVPWRGESPWIVQQLYGEVRYRCLGAMAGAKEMWGQYVDPRLSSGGLLYSGNARPIPQVRIGIFNYADIWGTRGWLGVKGYIAYGAFTDSRWQRNWVMPGESYTSGVLYQGKGLWFRNGNADKFPLVVEAGIEMATEFGGTIYNYHDLQDGKVKTIHMPHNLKAWLKAFLPTSGSSSELIDEQNNVEGNVVGAWQFCASWNPKADWKVKAYYEHYFEDHSMLYIEYPWKDGLIGLEGTLPKNPFVSKIVYEYLHLKDQTGPVYWDSTDNIPDQVSAADGYYDHYLYNGWQTWGMNIGTPLVLSPIFNPEHSLTFRSSRVIAHHVGISGDPTPELNWRMLLSFSRHWGTYLNILPEVGHSFSGLIEATWRPARFKGWEGSVAFAMDRGGFIGNSTGAMIRISKSGIFGR
ncbi:MAG: capsule assembly Wzi family protein [Muribaculaceae bacterium]|nr:capsule assembly Wzi family protein [Muribaculaceae bacterium]